MEAPEDRRINNFRVRLSVELSLTLVVKVIVNAKAPRNNWLQQFKTVIAQGGFPSQALPRAADGYWWLRVSVLVGQLGVSGVMG